MTKPQSAGRQGYRRPCTPRDSRAFIVHEEKVAARGTEIKLGRDHIGKQLRLWIHKIKVRRDEELTRKTKAT